MPTYPCRIRKYRKAARLSQGELSLLAGIRSQGVMSEIEAGLKRPGLALAMAYELVLDAPSADLFPRLRAQTQRRVLGNAKRLHARIAASGRRRDTAAHLAALINRLSNDSSSL